MANKLAIADHLRTISPWEIGQANYDVLDAVAYREGRELSFEMGAPLHRVFIGRVQVGFVHAQSFGFVTWPYIYPASFSGVTPEMLHEEADRSTDLATCYFIGGETGPVKIGYTLDVRARLSSIRSHSPVPVGLLATRAGGRAREYAYHEQFAAHRLHGEWFERVPEIEAEIATLTEGSAA